MMRRPCLALHCVHLEPLGCFMCAVHGEIDEALYSRQVGRLSPLRSGVPVELGRGGSCSASWLSRSVPGRAVQCWDCVARGLTLYTFLLWVVWVGEGVCGGWVALGGPLLSMHLSFAPCPLNPPCWPSVVRVWPRGATSNAAQRCAGRGARWRGSGSR